MKIPQNAKIVKAEATKDDTIVIALKSMCGHYYSMTIQNKDDELVVVNRKDRVTKAEVAKQML